MIKKVISIAVVLLLISTTPFVAGLQIGPYIHVRDTTKNSSDDSLDFSTDPYGDAPSTFMEKPSFAPNELIIAFKDQEAIRVTTSPDGRLVTGSPSTDLLNHRYHVVSAEKLLENDTSPMFSDTYVFTFPDGTDIHQVQQAYSQDQAVDYAEPNYFYYPCHVPNDPYFPLQWALQNTGQTGGIPGADIHATEAWDLETGDPGVIVAVIDTGVDYTNPDSGNYTVTEEPYTLESPHPINVSGFKSTVSFPGYDSVSLHITAFNVSYIPGFAVKKHFPPLHSKTLFSSFLYDQNATNLWTNYTDVWTKYSEDGGSKNITLSAGGPQAWGFAIDKVRKMVWRPLHEISPMFVDGKDLFFHTSDPIDDVGHGTHCIGIIAATMDNSQGIAGIAPGCRIMPIKLSSNPLGAMTLSVVSQALVYAVSHGARIISMSLGGPKSRTMVRALDHANSKGVILVAAAGNSNINDKAGSYPAAYPAAIAVAATDANDSRAVFSNFGSWVDVAAPGVDIVSLRAHGTDMYLLDNTAPPGSHFFPAHDENATEYLASGTSMACPHVAGVAALVLSKNPNLTSSEVRTILRSSTDKVTSTVYCGTGRINAYAALLKTAPVVAELDHSLDDTDVTGTIDIAGTAQGDQFQRFDVEYARGIYPNETNWIPLSNSSSPASGTMATLDASGLQEGLYTIRLLVNASGSTYEDLMVIVANNKPNTFFVDSHNLEGPWDGTQEHPFTSIQYAIECCGTRKDDVSVASGMYREPISVGKNKAIHIHGAGKTTTFLLGSHDASIGVSLSEAKFVTLEGFTVANFSAGVGMQQCKAVAIHDNRFVDNSLGGVMLILCFGNFFYDNDFIRNKNNTLSMYSLNLWYNPLKLKGNYWDDYTRRYPDAQPRLVFPWSWEFPYKVSTYWTTIGMGYLPKFLRFGFNNDRFPLVNP